MASEAAPAASSGFSAGGSMERACNGDNLVRSQLASDGVDYAILDPDHARPDHRLDQRRLVTIHRCRLCGGESLRNRQRKRRAGILDRLDLAREFGWDAGLREQVVLELGLRRPAGVDGRHSGLRDHQGWRLKLASAAESPEFEKSGPGDVDERACVDDRWTR